MDNGVLGRMIAPVALMASCMAMPAFAQSAEDFAAMRADIVALRGEQGRLSGRVADLEAELARARQAGFVTNAIPPAVAAPIGTANAPAQTAPATLQANARPPQSSPAAAINPAGGSAPGIAPSSTASKLAINGDVRVRYEANFGDEDGRDRHRGVMRARLRALYTFNPTLAIGAQVSTGDGDDPNSTDITLTGFNDDLDLSLDQVYARLSFGDLTLWGGKYPQQLVRTEMVWDGDVSIEGVGATYRVNLGGGNSIRAHGLYYLVDEAPTARDSSMIGGQVALELAASPNWRFEAAAGYYDFRLHSTIGGDAGDFRSNRFAGGRYLSDFNLLDVVGAVQYNGLGERWPIRVVGDYVHNFGATVDGDTGYGVDVLFGRASRKNDWRVSYGYAETGVDAVLTAFSHDNTNLASNYLQHSVAFDYVPMNNVVLNLTYYRYRPKDAAYAGTNQVGDWLDRMRLNFLVTF